MAPNSQTVWDGVLVKTNRYGLRDHEGFLRKGNSFRRIAVLGDSYSFGLGVPVEETFPKVLERLLDKASRASGYHYEVPNFAVIGYCSRDEALLLRYRVLVWDADVVILGYVLNDPETDPTDNLHSYFVKPRWWQYSHLFRLVARVKHNWDVERLGGGDYYKYLHAQGGEKWNTVLRAFGEIKDATSPRGIRVLVVIFPMVTPRFWGRSWAAYPYRGIHKQVSDLAVKNGFQVIDLYDVYSKYAPRDVVLGRWDEHPNGLAHQLAAQAIAHKLLAEQPSFSSSKEQEHRP